MYDFLAGYKHNFGIYINNFFRDRDYKNYCEDKFVEFEFDVTGIMSANLFGDLGFSIQMVKYLEGLEKYKAAYYPVNTAYIEHLINFSEVLDILKPLEEDIIVYTGQTRYIEMTVTSLDLLTEFLKMLENPSREYSVIRDAQQGEYEKAVQTLKTYLDNRNNTDLTRRLSKFN